MCQYCREAKIDDGAAPFGFEALETDFTLTGYTIPDDATTGASIAVGSTRTDRLDYRGDADWFQIRLSAGQTVQIDLDGTGADALEDPYLRLFDANSTLVAQDDDDGPGLNSSLVFTAGKAGTYFVEVDSFADTYDGDYRLRVAEVEAPSLIDVVKGRTALDTSDPVYVYFAESGDRYVSGSNIYIANGVNSYERGQLWSIFEGVETFVDIDFRITTNRGQADLEWATDGIGSSLLGFFYFPTASGQGGYGLLNDAVSSWSDQPGGGLDDGGFMYGVAIHELGHGLGLGHTHDSGNGTRVMQGVSHSRSYGDFELNQTVFTAMSYIDGWETGPNGLPPGRDYGYSKTFGAIDIAALQEVYGANTTHARGNDIYRLDNQNGRDTGYEAIWDTGGFDTFLYEGSRDATIDLRAATLTYREGGGGFVSSVDGVHAGLTIANGVVIEAAETGSGNDVLGGNGTHNTLSAGAGDDSLRGYGGDDVLEGGAGADFINGGAGEDTASFAAARAAVAVDLETGKGTRGDAAGDRYIGVEHLTGGSGHDDLRGDDLLNRLSGGSGNDALFGRQGDDRLEGGAGNDRLFGNSGADTLIGGGGHDRFIFYAASDSGPGSANRDKIVDFGVGNDRIDLSRLFDDAETSRDDKLTFLGRVQFSGEGGELRHYQNAAADLTIIEMDATGDGVEDLQIELKGLFELSGANFIL
ncbi:MAG: M10 family metallopeptidase C-terminal domain-containing protein [Pseudomonadota bacterium]